MTGGPSMLGESGPLHPGRAVTSPLARGACPPPFPYSVPIR
jgi:hypothetical protein